jgi:two-component system OmpR family response regulator
MNKGPHILVVDDDAEIRGLLRDYLQKNGLRASAAADGKAMWALLAREHVDLIVLDLMLPGDDGLVLCRNLRAQSDVPVIMLTAKGEDMDRIIGLEMGADDYLPKPFNPRELLARIKTVLRRAPQATQPDWQPGQPTRLRFAGWTLDLAARHLIAPDGVIVSLSGSEYRLLRIFLAHPHRVLSRDRLLDLTQGREAGPFDRSIDVQVSRLRQRLNDSAREPAIIKTVRSEGYVLAANVESAV